MTNYKVIIITIDFYFLLRSLLTSSWSLDATIGELDTQALTLESPRGKHLVQKLAASRRVLLLVGIHHGLLFLFSHLTMLWVVHSAHQTAFSEMVKWSTWCGRVQVATMRALLRFFRSRYSTAAPIHLCLAIFTILISTLTEWKKNLSLIDTLYVLSTHIHKPGIRERIDRDRHYDKESCNCTNEQRDY